MKIAFYFTLALAIGFFAGARTKKNDAYLKNRVNRFEFDTTRRAPYDQDFLNVLSTFQCMADDARKCGCKRISDSIKAGTRGYLNLVWSNDSDYSAVCCPSEKVDDYYLLQKDTLYRLYKSPVYW